MASALRLDSWKEIAAFFRRDPRTLRRWEKERALPVHRIPGKGRSAVYAYPDELQQWLQERPLDPEELTDPELADGRSGSTDPQGRAPWSWRRRSLVVLLLAVGVGSVWVVAARHRPRPDRTVEDASVEIQQAYLGCRYVWSKRSAGRLQEAVDCFTRLTRQAPRFAPAYAGLADAYNLLREYSRMPDSEAFPRALAAAQRAVELDPGASLGHRSLAFAAFNWSFDVPTAEREFRTAIALDPHDADAHHWFATSLMLLGRYAEALEEIGRAQELEPTSSSIVADRGFILYAAGQREEAREVESRLARTEPELVSPHRYLAEMHFHQGEYPDYLVESRRLAELLGDADSLSAMDDQRRALAAGGPAALLEEIRVERQARHARGVVGAYSVAQIESLLGLREEALSHLEEAVARHEPLSMAMGIDPNLIDLRGELRYQQLLMRLGLSAAAPGGPSPRAAR